MISIIVPTRNRIHLLEKALAGILAQSWADYEVIVVDDASDLHTREAYPDLFSRFDTRFRLIYSGDVVNQKGVGPSSSRNLGMAAAQGEILAFCDDDDFWIDSSHVAAIVSVFTHFPNVDMYIANQRAVSVDGHIRPDWIPALTAQAKNLPPLEGQSVLVSKDNLAACGSFAHLNMLSLRKTVLTQVNGFWESISYEEDRDFFWRCADACDSIAFNPEVVSQHNVPNPKLRVNASTLHSQHDRWMISALVSRHIAVTVKHTGMVKNALHQEADLLRRLAQSALTQGQSQVAFALAKQALMLRFSFKWAAYCIWLGIKNLAHAGKKTAD